MMIYINQKVVVAVDVLFERATRKVTALRIEIWMGIAQDDGA